MDMAQILCTLRNVKTFLRVFLSDCLPHSFKRSSSIIINAERGWHWLVIHFETRSSSAYYFDSYRIPLTHYSNHPSILETQLHRLGLQCVRAAWSDQHGPRPNLLPIALYMERGYTPKQFVGLFTLEMAARQTDEIFTSEFGPLGKEPSGGQCSYNIYKSYVANCKFIIFNSYVDRNGGGNQLRIPEGETR